MDNIYFITIFSLLFLLVLAAIGMKKNYNTITSESFLSVSQTNWLRGMSIIMIMLAHYYSLLGITNIGSLWQLGGIALLGVALFLFLSGYGAMYSKINKSNYLKGYLPKRLFRLFIPFIVVFVLDVIVLFTTGQGLSWTYFAKIPILSLPGTLNWYLKVQLALYIVFYLMAKLIKNSNYLIFSIFMFCFIYMITGHLIGIDCYWYESSYMFPLGMLFAKYKEGIFSFLNSRYIFTAFSSVILLLLLYLPYYLYGGPIFEIIAILGMVQFVICLCVKTQGSFKLTIWIGTISLELYLVHSAVLNSFIVWLNYKENIFSFIIFILGSVLLSYLVNIASKAIQKRILSI